MTSETKMAPPKDTPKLVPATPNLSNQEVKALTLHTLHDLTLIVGSKDHSCGQKIFRVNSTILKISSKYWETMLAGPFAESAMKEIPFPEDSPKAFQVFLQIVHFKLHELPNSMSKDDLVDLAKFCDKYFVADIVRPYTISTAWLWPHKKDGGFWKPNIDLQDWVFILSVFNHAADFELLVNRIAVIVRYNPDDGSLYFMQGEWQVQVLDSLPDKILNKIREKRTNLLTSISDVMNNLLHRAFTENTCRNKSSFCQATKVGILTMTYRGMNLDFLPKISASAMNSSVRFYLRAFKGMATEYRAYNHGGWGDFSSCMRDLAAADSIPEIIDRHTQKGFYAQLEKAGCT